jgi:hypothetical protein
MRRFLLPGLILLAAALPAAAGVSYKIESVTSGLQSARIAGSVVVDGSKMRIDFTSGDGMLLKSDSILLTADGGKTVQVYDPTTKTYFELPVDQLFGNTLAALKSAGDMVKISFDNPNAAAKDEGDGPAVAGYPTRKSHLDASFDINVDAMGQKITSHITLTAERWTTDKLPAAAMNVLMGESLHTGIEAVDKLVAAQESLPKGFVLKQVSTLHVIQGTQDLVSTSTSSVTEIETKQIAADRFTPPAGYSKTASPIEKMLKR